MEYPETFVDNLLLKEDNTTLESAIVARVAYFRGNAVRIAVLIAEQLRADMAFRAAA